MRVTATPQRRVSRSAVIRQHRMDRQRFKLGSSRNGISKWFATTAHTLRLRRSIPFALCARKAVPTPSNSAVMATPTATQPEAHTNDTRDRNPLDLWFEVEDLWSRLARITQVTVVNSGDAVELMFADVGAEDWDDDALALIARALDAESYLWRQDGARGDYVQLVELRGVDLVLTLTSSQQMARLPEGENIRLMVESFLVQLQRGGASC